MQDFLALGAAVLTVSDTRDSSNDTSGDFLAEALTTLGHRLQARDLVRDDKYLMRATLSAWIAAADIQIIIITGGTGMAGRDLTPEAVQPLLDKSIPGFGELFRALSYDEIGSSTVQSRAFAGVANSTLVFALPGSTGACRTAWNKILVEQLDARNRPCNFIGLYQKQ